MPADPSQAQQTTRAALVTPGGVGGVAMVQVCGPEAWSCVRPHLVDGAGRAADWPAPKQPRLLRWSEQDQVIDQVLVSAVLSGRRRADQVTICTHGGVRIVERILLSLSRAGVQITANLEAAQAWPHLDPVERAVMDALPRCQTRRVVNWLLEQVAALPRNVQRITALIETGRLEPAAEALRGLADTTPIAGRLLDGTSVVLLGPPNAGKSTLANRLFDRPRSLESPHAGTTRDWVQQGLAIDGIPVVLSDTAGVGAPRDELDAAAQALSRPLIVGADVQVVVLDISTKTSAGDASAIRSLLDPQRAIVVFNKIDLIPEGQRHACLAAAIRTTGPSLEMPDCSCLMLSGRTGAHLDVLRDSIRRRCLRLDALPIPSIWTPEQADAVAEALGALPEVPERALSALARWFFARCP